MAEDLDVKELLAAQVGALAFPLLISRVSDAIIVYANDVAIKQLEHWGEGLPVGKNANKLDFYSPEEPRDVVVERARAEGGYMRRNDFFDGGEDDVELVYSNTLRVNGEEYLATILVGITEILEVEIALADALSRLEKAQAIAKTGDFVTTLATDEFNGSAEAMRILGFGREASSVSIRELFSHFHPDDKGSVAKAMSDQLPNGSFTVEHRLSPGDGGERWVHTQGTVETDEQGRSFVRGTVQDVTERKREEQERQDLNEKMQEAQRLESLGLLAGGIAHDFNNLLAGIMGNADFALLESNATPEIQVRLQDIISASRRAADLTRQLLAYSGKGRFVIEAVDLSAMIREMADLLTMSISRGNSLRFNLLTDLPSVEVDSTQIRQVVMNLIINAGEAIEAGNGNISLATGVQNCDEGYLEASGLRAEIEPGKYVYFEVSDDGVGMDEETLARIFDPFFTTKFTGRGLGLAAALGIARGHRGAIKIYSEPGRGTTFKVLLPVSKEGTVSPNTTQVRHSEWQGQGTVLVIDDDETVREFVKPVLERYGYEVLLADDGVLGLQAFRANAERIRLVLLDLTMPNMDGQETFAQLKRMQRDLPVVLMSGYNEQDATQRFVGKGLAGFLSKPFLVADLMGMVQAQLGEQKPKSTP